MKRAFLLAALVALAPACKSQPGAVDLTIVADPSLSDATVAAIRVLDVTVTGAAMVGQSYLVDKPFGSSRQERLLIRPSVSSGMLTIAVLARAGAGTPLGYGTTTVALSSSGAVAATVTLTGNIPSSGDMGAPDMNPLGPSLALVAGRIGGQGWVDASGAAARFFQPRGIALEGGKLYVADMNNHVIRQIDPATGAVTTFAGKPLISGSADGSGSAARFQRPNSIVGDGAGNLYVSDMRNNTIRKIVVATAAVTTIAGTAGSAGSTDATGAAARFDHPHGLALDGAGNLYVADNHNNTIRKIVLAGGAVTTLAGTAGMQGNVDATGAAARFARPHALACDGGNLYVADSVNNSIRQIVVSSGVVTTFAGPTNGNGGSADGVGAAARFDSPRGIAADGVGNLWVADSGGNRLRKIVIAGAAVTTIAGGTFNPNDGVGAGAGFELPFALVSDGSGALYSTDGFGSSIRKTVVASGAVSTLAGFAGANGLRDDSGGNARFHRPHGLWLDGTTLYVADKANNAVRKIDLPTAQVSTVAGGGPAGSADGVGAVARFNGPFAVCSDGAGKLFVADNANHTIRVIALATNTVSTLAGSPGTRGNTDGTGAAARFSSPSGVACAGANLYVADSDNATIRQIVVASGAVTTIAGTAGARGGADGVGAAARFNSPAGLAVDGNTLYVADQANHAIRSVALGTMTVATLAGSAGVRGSVDGPGTMARFFAPHSLVADGMGNLYVADTLSHALRKIVIATTVVSTIAGNPGVASVQLGPAPGGLNTPSGIALAPGGAIYMTTTHENAVLVLQ